MHHLIPDKSTYRMLFEHGCQKVELSIAYCTIIFRVNVAIDPNLKQNVESRWEKMVCLWSIYKYDMFVKFY